MILIRVGAALSIGYMGLYLRRIGVDRQALALEILADGLPKAHLGDGVRRPGERGLEPARHLVLPLRARLESRDAPLDAELDSLVIARLEVQAVIVGCGTPVAAVERPGPEEEDRRGDRMPGVHGELHHPGIPERAGYLGKERPGQIRLVPMAQEGVAVEG